MASANDQNADLPVQTTADSSPDLLTDNDTESTQKQSRNDTSSSLLRKKGPRIISIIDLDPQKINSIPKITEKESCLAMLRLGVEPEDLVKLSKDSISKIPGNTELQNKVASELEKRRLDTIENIKEERQKIINEQKENNNKDIQKSPNSTTTSTQTNNNTTNDIILENHKNRFEKIRKTQLLNIIKEQQQRKLIAKKDINVQRRIEQVKEHRQQQIQLRKDQEDEKVRLLSEKKQEIAQNQLEKIQQEEELRQNRQPSNQRPTDIVKQQIQQQRKEKLQQILSQQKQRQIEEAAKNEEKLQISQNRQNLIEKKRLQILSNVQTKARENEKKIEQKMQLLKQREEEKRLQNEEKLKKRTETAENLAMNGQIRKLNEAAEKRFKEQQKIEAARQRSLSKSGELVEEMKREICRKQMKAEMNFRSISLLRQRRYNAANTRTQQRSLSALQTKQEREEKLKEERATKYQQKLDEAQKRADGVRVLCIARAQERAASGFLRQKLGEQRVARAARARLFESLARERRVAERCARTEEAASEARAARARQLEEMRRGEADAMERIARLQAELEANPDADIVSVAAALGIDLAEFMDIIGKEEEEAISEPGEVKSNNGRSEVKSQIVMDEVNDQNSLDEVNVQNVAGDGDADERDGVLDETFSGIGNKMVNLPADS